MKLGYEEQVWFDKVKKIISVSGLNYREKMRILIKLMLNLSDEDEQNRESASRY